MDAPVPIFRLSFASFVFVFSDTGRFKRHTNQIVPNISSRIKIADILVVVYLYFIQYIFEVYHTSFSMKC